MLGAGMDVCVRCAPGLSGTRRLLAVVKKVERETGEREYVMPVVISAVAFAFFKCTFK